MSEDVIPSYEVASLIGVETQPNGRVVVGVRLEGTEERLGLLFLPETADELTGALIEYPESGFRELGSAGQETVFDVETVELRQGERDVYVLRLAADGGSAIQFHLGRKRLIQLRNLLTGQIARKIAAERQ